VAWDISKGVATDWNNALESIRINDPMITNYDEDYSITLNQTLFWSAVLPAMDLILINCLLHIRPRIRLGMVFTWDCCI
jgi:hypothetical protein